MRLFLGSFLLQFWCSFWCSFCYFPVQILRRLGGSFRLHSCAVFGAFLGQFLLLPGIVSAAFLVQLFLLLSGIDSTGVEGQFSAAFWCCFVLHLGCSSGYFLVQFLRLIWCNFCCFPVPIPRLLGGSLLLLSGAFLNAFFLQFLLLFGTNSVGVGGQCFAASPVQFRCIFGAVSASFR